MISFSHWGMFDAKNIHYHYFPAIFACGAFDAEFDANG